MYMKICKIIVIACAIAIGSNACKDNVPEDINSITAGQIENLNITSLDTTIGFYEAIGNQSSQFFELDVDNDGTNDLRFQGLQEFWHGPTNYVTNINCLNNNISLLTSNVIDTIYFSSSTTFAQQGDATWSITYLHYNCQRLSENDIIDTIINNTILQNLSSGEIIDRNQLWGNAVYNMRKYNYTFPPVHIYSSNDTAYYEGISRQMYCHNFPQNEIIYLGFKISSENLDKLGWIKIELSDNYKIRIFEYALTN
jgi:hypothetical protein